MDCNLNSIYMLLCMFELYSHSLPVPKHPEQSYSTKELNPIKGTVITTNHHATEMLTEPTYDVINSGLWSDNDVKLTSDPAYAATVQVESDPAYFMSGNKIMESDYM